MHDESRAGHLFRSVEADGARPAQSDLELLAGLGVSGIRYPVLWERTAPHGLAEADWSFADDRLGQLWALGLQPIVGLVHHGSGPRHTSLLDERFPHKLAEYALAVARRYPWITDFTPINEPLTTARFSALYGHWYPHHRSGQSFVRALLIQTRATLMAMAAIRTVVPNARLVQTEDIGAISSTAGIAYQAEYENHRRFLSLDLLHGRVRSGHPLYRHLLALGATPGELSEIADLARPPELIGVNYYITSDRFLDERIELYPPERVGGNGRHRYVDTEAVRANAGGITGHENILRQVWSRYRTPLALTEVHLGCSPEEQLRWLAEAWHGANAARTAGVDVRALTLWSAFGAYDWSSLVTRDDGHYESGVFDVRGGDPQPTPLADAARALALRAELDHPCLSGASWWRSDSRFAVSPYGHPHTSAATSGVVAQALPEASPP